MSACIIQKSIWGNVSFGFFVADNYVMSSLDCISERDTHTTKGQQIRGNLRKFMWKA